MNNIYTENFFKNDESFSLLEEKLQSKIDNLVKNFIKNKKEYEFSYEKDEKLRKIFVDFYNMKYLMEMKKEDYAIGLKRHDTFCYRIENDLKSLGDIHGANASKFGLYYGKSGDDKEKKYRLAKKFGEDVDAGFEEIKKEIVDLRVAGDNEDYEKIRKCKFAPLYRGKILSTFFPEKYLAVFSNAHLTHFMAKLGVKPKSKDELDMQRQLLEWKNNNDQLKELNNYLFMKFLYLSFGRPLEKDSSIKEAQKKRDEEYPKDYVSKININIKQWENLLKNPEVFKREDIELLKRFYLSDNHASTCYELGAQDGVSPYTYIKPVVALAKRIQTKMSLPTFVGTDGKEAWWRIPFWGCYREDGHFEWKVRPELASALKNLYPELELNKINCDEDEKLVAELKRAGLVSVKEDFEYGCKPKEKKAAIYVRGHKTYPRDRQIAINALVHAHYSCEIDNNHITFIRRNSDKPYTEPHHLIPMAFSDEFDVSLDIEENIVSLCSNCHNQIHYGENADVLLRKLFDERKDALEKAGIKITFKRLLEMYNIQGSEDLRKKYTY